MFDAFINPAKIALWWGPDDGPVLSVQVDARPGGHFHIRFRLAEDGSEHGSSGTFEIFDPPRQLVMTWAWDNDSGPASRVHVVFRAVESGTEVTLVHSRLDETKAKDHEKGWNGAFDKLAAMYGIRVARRSD